MEEFRGRRQLRLRDLHYLPDPVLGRVIPMVREDVEILVEGHEVRARFRGEETRVLLFDVEDPVNVFILNRFNGRTNIDETSADLACQMGRTAEEAFACVKQMFLRMVDLRVCAPSNPIE
jgi:hypothetical protein